MEKNEGSPEKSASEQDLRRERPPPPPSSEGSESENLPAGGQGNRPPVRSTEEMMRAPVPVATPATPRPPPTRYRLVPARDNSGRVVVRESLPVNTHSNIVRVTQRGPRINSGREFFSCAISASWTITAPENKRKGQFRELPNRQPRCATCGKVFESWKALFAHMRSHHGREYHGAFPPPKASSVDPLITKLRNGFKGLHLREQRELTLSLMNATTAVSAMQIGEGSGAGRSSERRSEVPSADLNTRGKNRRSLMNDGLELNLNSPPPLPESDSEDENP